MAKPGEEAAGAPTELEGATTVTDQEEQLKEPRQFKVLLHNDNYTTMDFVVRVLRQVFFHSESEAVRIMLEVHQKGIGVAGIFGYEVAETRVNKVIHMAREHDYPLRCSLEPE